MPFSITRRGAFSEISCRQTSRYCSRLFVGSGVARSQSLLRRMLSSRSKARQGAKTGSRGGPRSGEGEINTSLKSRMSNGASPHCHSQFRKPQYSCADRRLNHTILRWSGNRASSQSRSEGARSSGSVRPSSFSSHILRAEGSVGSIGPMFRPCQVVTT